MQSFLTTALQGRRGNEIVHFLQVLCVSFLMQKLNKNNKCMNEKNNAFNYLKSNLKNVGFNSIQPKSPKNFA